MKVMLAVDDSDHSEYALESVVKRPWAPGTQFLVFMVCEPYHPDFAGWDEHAVEQAKQYARRLETTANAYVEKCANRIKEAVPDCSVESEVIESGRIKETIIQRASTWSAELIVMGSHGRTGLERFLLGSVSQAVVSHAPCSVEIVKRSTSPV